MRKGTLTAKECELVIAAAQGKTEEAGGTYCCEDLLCSGDEAFVEDWGQQRRSIVHLHTSNCESQLDDMVQQGRLHIALVDTCACQGKVTAVQGMRTNRYNSTWTLRCVYNIIIAVEGAPGLPSSAHTRGG